jgi:hypothetical protein
VLATKKSVCTVARNLKDAKRENSVRIAVTSNFALLVMAVNKSWEKEQNYQLALYLCSIFFRKGLLTEPEFIKVKRELLHQFAPPITGLEVVNNVDKKL